MRRILDRQAVERVHNGQARQCGRRAADKATDRSVGVKKVWTPADKARAQYGYREQLAKWREPARDRDRAVPESFSTQHCRERSVSTCKLHGPACRSQPVHQRTEEVIGGEVDRADLEDAAFRQCCLP